MTADWNLASRRPSRTLLAALLGALALSAYALQIPNGYAFDDGRAVLHNPVVQGELPASQAFVRDYWGQPKENSGGSYRPLAVLSLRLDQRLGGGRAWVFHLVNAVLHAAVVVVAFVALEPLAGGTLAFVALALFAVLCAPSEAVDAIVGRADLLGALFLLAGLAAHRRPGRIAAALAVTFFLFGLGSKESLVVAPLLYFIIDRFIPEGRVPRAWPRYAGYAFALAVALVARVHALGSLRGSGVTIARDNPLAGAALAPRLFGAAKIIGEQYAVGLVDAGRRLYQCSRPACGPSDASSGWAWFGIALALVLVFAPPLLRRRSPVSAIGLRWAALTFLPVSNLVVLAPTAYGERLLYMPAMGLCLAFSALVLHLARRRPVVTWSLFGALLLMNVTLLQARHRDWRNNDTLFLSGVRAQPMDAKNEANYAATLVTKGDFAGTIDAANRALALYPDDGKVCDMLAVSLDHLGRASEAEHEYRVALGTGTDEGIAVEDYGDFLVRHGRSDEARRMLRHFLSRGRGTKAAAKLLERLESESPTAPAR